MGICSSPSWRTCVRTYKSWAQVERAFRSIKTMDLKLGPSHHHLEGRVRSHIFLGMLAYYVEWRMRQVWRELMFADEDQAAKLVRDPVAPATLGRGDEKVLSLTLEDGSPVHSFQTLMATLQTIVCNTCRTPGGAPDAPTFEIITSPNHTQKRALELIAQIKPSTERGTKINVGFIGALSFLGKELQLRRGLRMAVGEGLKKAIRRDAIASFLK